MVRCAKCGAENRDGVKSCSGCGGDLGSWPRFCVACGRSIGFDVRVCPYCGHDYSVVPQSRPRESLDAGVKVILYIVSFLVPVAGIVIGLILMSRDGDDYKHAGKMCLVLGVVSLLVSVGLSALLYFMVLGFESEVTVTPVTSLTKTPMVGGWMIRVSFMSDVVEWSDVGVTVSDGTDFVSWHPASSDLEGFETVTVDCGSESLGDLTVTLSITDIMGNSCVDGGDAFTVTSSPVFDAATDYWFTLIHEPTGQEMASLPFTG